ncbi:DUF418 domain-containing protein [Shouchella patagoniensis]|uniref:DUF418 domain-containing protein n=1 Tax=Shouchella patagoniensis TaxID=228576 RepID=UPI000994A799|nr:DUF418 domain-containing protein [Shouchella patagoniensis]
MNQQRNHMVDGIRGLCLLGILLANMLIFQYGLLGTMKLELFTDSKIDAAALWIVQVFIEGSFMPIFAFLFGYGMIKLSESLDRRGLRVKWTLTRRAFGLIVLGFLHSYFIWEGDILLTYGFTCLALLFFVRRKRKTVIIWGISIACLAAIMSYGSLNDLSALESDGIVPYIEKTTPIYQDGSYSDIQGVRQDEEALMKAMDIPEGLGTLLITLISLVLYIPMFLFGMYAAKRNWFSKQHGERLFFAKAASLLVTFGLLFKILHQLMPDQGWTGIGYGLSNFLLPLGYIFLIAACYQLLSLIRPFIEAVGKLSLSNYLLQSIICTTIFYGYGLGFFGQLGVLNGIFLAIGIYTILAYLSYLYLKKWTIGPAEHLLRMIVYVTWTGKPRNKRTESLSNKEIS